MHCPRCQHENREGRRFCAECGAPFALPCPSCGFSNEGGEKFCGGCGTPLTPTARTPEPRFTSPQSYTPKHLAEKILTSKSALEGERKQVTVLFADLKGSMELLADRDPEEARRLLDPVLERMMEAVHRYEGTVNQVMGDGIMALFGAPVAHEDHAVRACYAALDMQGAIRRCAEDLRRTHGVKVQIRVGLNSGEVVVRAIESDLRMDYTAVGQTTHLAARMEQLADPGTTLLTADTLGLAEGYIDVKPTGPVPVKGLDAPVEVYELVGAGPQRSRLHAAAARGLTRFVARDVELEQLRQALSLAGAGHGQVVAVVGEPGVGKSRLVWEVTHSHRTHGWLVVLAGSVSYGKATPYLPVTDLLKGYFKIQDRDDRREIREKVIGKLLALDRALEPTLPALLALLDAPVEDPEWQALDPPQRRQRTLDALKRLLLRESQVQPLLVVFEDLHWIDSETQALLDSLVERVPTARLLLLVNYRPEYEHRWGSRTYYIQLRLDPLPPESAGELLRVLLGDDATLEPLKRVLTTRTGGNPFFLEESVRTLVEAKVLVGERGAYRLAQPLETFQVPATVQTVLAARIDRLAPAEKRLLQSAAVIGKDVPFALLQAIAEEPEDVLRRGLAHLQAAEFLYQTSLFPDLEYTFKHALTHEVTYKSLLTSRQQALHAAIGRALEVQHANCLEQVYGSLAHHYSRAEEADRAVECLGRFAEKAARGHAHKEAVRALEQALKHVERLPVEEQDRRRLEITLRQVSSLIPLGRFDEILNRLLQQRERLERLQDAALAGHYYLLLGRTYSFLGDHERAAQSAQCAITEAEQSKDDVTLGKAFCLLGLEAPLSGGALQGIAHAQQAVTRLERTGDRTWLGTAHWVLGLNYASMGTFELALDAEHQARIIGEAIGDRRLQTYAAWASGMIYAAMGEWELGVEACQLGLACSPDPLNTAIASGWHGYAHLESGDTARAIPLLERSAQQLGEFRFGQFHGWFTVLLAEAHRTTGQLQKALELATHGIEIMRAVKFDYGVGWAQRALGRIAQAKDDPAGAATHLTAAFQTFASIHARYELGRTHLDLAALAHAQGDRQAVATHLNAARDLFTVLRVPRYVERAAQLATRFGVSLSENARE